MLRTFAEISGLNMVIDPQVQGRVDIVLNEVPWDQALDTILRGNKLGWTVDGSIVRIVPLSVLTEEQRERAQLQQQQALAGETRVQTFALSYAKAGELSPLLTSSALSQRGKIQVDARTNTLIITDLPDRLQTAASLIGTLDRPEPQVEVEARIVQTTRDFARAVGIQWGLNGRVTPATGQHPAVRVPEQRHGWRPRRRHPGPDDPRGTGTNDNTSTVVNLGAAGSFVGHRPRARIRQWRVQSRRRAHRAREQRQGADPLDAPPDDAEQLRKRKSPKVSRSRFRPLPTTP